MTSWFSIRTARASIPHSSCRRAPTAPPGRPSVRRRRVQGLPSIHSRSPPTVRRCATSATPLSLMNLGPTGARSSSYRPFKARVRLPNRPPSCSLAPVSLRWVSLAASASDNSLPGSVSQVGPSSYSQPFWRAMRAPSVRLAAPSLLADGFGEVVAHGALRKAEPFGDLRAAIAFARVAQHLAFAVGERVGFGSGFGGRFGIDHASPRANRSEERRVGRGGR